MIELWDKVSSETKTMVDKMVAKPNKKLVVWVLLGLFIAFILALPASISSNIVMDYYNQFSENAYFNYKAARCSSPLKVYMYELPRKYNIGMLNKDDENQEIPWTNHVAPPWKQKYEVNNQHSVEYWMMVYLLDGLDPKDGQKAAIRVKDPHEADVFFVPFFSALSLNSHGGVVGPGAEQDKQLQVRPHCFLF